MHRERHAMIQGRVTSRNLIEAIFANYELIDKDNMVVNAKSNLVLPYLAQQAKCLLAYKAEAVKQGSYSDNLHCTYSAVVMAFRRYCVNNEDFLTIFNSCDRFDSFAWTSPAWSIRRKTKRSKPKGT